MKLFICIIFFFINSLCAAQNVGINSTGAIPNNSAELDLNTGNNFASPNGKGLIIPNIALTSATDAATIGTGNVTGMLIYNTSTAGAQPNNVTPGYYYWNGAMWIRYTDNNFYTYSQTTTLFGLTNTLKTITVTTQAGDNVALRGEFDFNKSTSSYVAVGIERNGIEIHEIAVLTNNNADNSAHVQWVDVNPGAGVQTYRLRYKIPAGAFNTIYGSSLHAIILKQ